MVTQRWAMAAPRHQLCPVETDRFGFRTGSVLFPRGAFIRRLDATGLLSLSQPLSGPFRIHSPFCRMLDTMVNANDNVDTSVQPPDAPQKQPHKPSSIPPDEQIYESFFEWGLVEVLLKRDNSHAQMWHDAYIIDVEKIVIEESKDENANTSKPGLIAHTCTVVLAVDGEDPLTTLTNPKNIQKCLLEQVRLKLKFDPESDFTDIDMVHVLMETEKPFICWQAGKVKMAKDDVFVVETVNPTSENSPVVNGSVNLDLYSKDRLRPLSASYQLTEENNPFYRFTLPLSQELLKIHGDIQWMSNYALHKDFKKYSQLISVSFDCETPSLVCLALASCKDQSVKRSQLLVSMHIEKLKENYVLFSRMNPNRGVNTGVVKPGEFVLNLEIQKKYIGLAIGKAGVNIQKVRKLPGIISLDLNDQTSTFIIRGNSKEACQAAADALNFGDESVKYPKDYGKLFLDRKFVEDMVSKSGVVKVELFKYNVATAEEIELLIIGKPEAVENFKIILEFQKAEMDEIASIKEQNRMMIEELFNNRRCSNNTTLAAIANKYISAPKNFAEAVKLGIKN